MQNENSLFYKMVQQLGQAEVTALTERAKQVSLLPDFVISLSPGSLFTRSPPRVWEHAVCALFNQKPPERKLHDWVLTTCGRWKAGLLRICSSAGGGVGMCEPFCVRAPVPEREILDLTFHMFGLQVQILMEHKKICFFQTLYIHSDWYSTYL